MSDHELVHEPERDRAYLSVFLVGVALVAAIVLGDKGKAVPQPEKEPTLANQGVVVLKHGQGTVRGVVVERGGSLKVIGVRDTHLIPRDHVEWYDKNSTKLPEKYQPRTPKPAPPVDLSKPLQDVYGTVIDRQDPAEVYVGRLLVSADAIRVITDVREVTLKRPNGVLWWEKGARGPNERFWERHPKARVRGEQNPNTVKRENLEAEAQLARLQGAWAEATRLYAKLYAKDGFQDVHLASLRAVVNKWLRFDPTKITAPIPHPSYADIVRIGHAPVVVDRLARYLEGMEKRPEIRPLLGGTLIAAAVHALHRNLRKSAARYARQLKELGGEWGKQGERILAGLGQE